MQTNILFENNTCVDAGCCWSHMQRPDRNGAHMMFYNNTALTTNVVIRHNIFVNSTEVCVRFCEAPGSGMEMKNNLYWQAPGVPFARVNKETYCETDFAAYQSAINNDAGSVFTRPEFIAPAARDYRLKQKTQYGAQLNN